MSVTARWCRQLDELPAGAWDALHDGTHPFISYAFLQGLEREGCLRPDWGWNPLHLTLWEGDTLVAAAPGYLKNNSHGEFVFDHAWAHAYARYGQEYFPKWLCGVPYSPVTGPRLLGAPQWRGQLLAAMRGLVERSGLSSAHVNFYPADEDAAFDADWLERNDLQYHWHNVSGWSDFETFLAAMDHKRRKNIRQERAKVQRAGVHLRVVHGDEASDADLDAMYGFYLKTFNEYGNSPALTPEFLRHLAQHLPRQLVMFLAELDGQPIAGALCLRGQDTLYGRYWGGEALPGLHFETCYYQGIEYCLREGLARFEPGAQGEHKIARGFLPTLVRSRHWIADPGFREPLAQRCADERQAVARHARELSEHSPFRD
ncbi:GNAT family N-acetyltransferase [Xanthomonas prunicola]|uniref:GNAT family N-acetyltransferase n=1 Tax=Xanthomonas prunicola TaxID=2053930 RepID=A0A9Q9MSP3_9XANT|nr:GNAT family N-acetyltransferase [Xanthomonas prunicola]UXA49074.1 GNAT family N-acetyltransferase [Xanthomonas prunicola]UXA57376.1 GNAT family N-acetyltransferase [Xanthomonas prunicola]UXA59537.1 GNAT family N-acetyltransferase [Xanthomonas prunicola]UXA65549.1 GNAT family N-acetyltransferase [Xanthomonas prunicola]